MIDYRLGGWVKNDQDFDYVIFEWLLEMFFAIEKTIIFFHFFFQMMQAISQVNQAPPLLFWEDPEYLMVS